MVGHSHTATQEHSHRRENTHAQLLASCKAESYTCTTQCARGVAVGRGAGGEATASLTLEHTVRHGTQQPDCE